MALPFLSPSRTVLIIGDEALSCYSVTYNLVRLMDVVPWLDGNFKERVVRLIRQDGGNKPVLLVNDMTDQHFKGGQRMPKVSMMDRSSVLDRKLQVAFPNYPIRGALEIKRGKKLIADEGSDKAARTAGGTYLFAAVPMSDAVAKTMEAVKESLVSIAGFVLLPIDSSDMVYSLSTKLSREGRPARWTIFIGQHRGGALRQVITREGQLAMTRMTPIPDNSQNPAEWAADVSQELKATVSYLSRFGYSADDGTDLIVVSTPTAGDALKELVDIPCNFTSFTVNEASRLLNMSIGLQEDQHYADPLHAGWIGRKSKFVLPMDAQELSSVSQPRQYAAVAMAAMLLVAAYLGWLLATQLGAMHESNNKIAEQNQTLIQVQSQENAEVQRMQALGFDVKLIQASMDSYEALKKNELEPLAAIHKIGQALGSELRLGSLRIEMVNEGDKLTDNSLSYQSGSEAAAPPPEPTAAADADKPKQMLATLTMNFPSTIEPTVGVQQVNDFRGRLQALFPGYGVNITRQVADLTYTTATSGKSGLEGAAGKSTQDYVAELQIRGAVH